VAPTLKQLNVYRPRSRYVLPPTDAGRRCPPAGDHTLTFQLAGFATVVREAVATGKKAHG
jgi:hypothetical protein